MGIEKAFGETSRVLFGTEIGELEGFDAYLSRYLSRVPIEKRSALSGKKVAACPLASAEDAKFISSDEAGEYAKMLGKAPLSINSIKDIDSLLGALEEKLYYSGSIVLGNSSEIEGSDKCIDSFCIYKSNDVTDSSKFVGYSNIARNCEYCFGLDLVAESKFIVSGFEVFKSARCFESLLAIGCSDCYYVAKLNSCSDCLFSFNLTNKRNCIGNLELETGKYGTLKQKLISEIAGTLAAKHDIAGIVGIMSAKRSPGFVLSQKKGSAPALQPEKNNAEEKAIVAGISSSFEATSRLLFGKGLKMSSLEAWLSARVPPITEAKSVLSGKRVFVGPLKAFAAIKDNVISHTEIPEMGARSISESDLAGVDMASLISKLDGIRYPSIEEIIGNENLNIVECACYGVSSANSYRTSFAFTTKNSAHCFYPKFSESVFGCYRVNYSKFCIRCHDSEKLTRCFEVSDSNSCTDCYYCHNCEDLENCILCFNVKGLRYAVGNREVGKEQFTRIKKMLQERILRELEAGGTLSLDILTINSAAAQKKKRGVKT